MSTFPVLKTGAVAQYPSQRTVRFSTFVSRFVDGSEQRSREFAAPLHRWVISLNDVDERELAAIDQFFLDQNGATASFQFTDPWDGTTYPDCRIAVDQVSAGWNGPGSGETKLVIEENRS